jgi:myo-inositol 2-dehydrogenase/D-chiro-inositol 1-dehydrogenase
MSASLRLGVIGGGRLTELGYVPAADGTEVAELVAIADPDGGRRERLAGLCGARTHATAGELIAAGGVDAIVVASPPEVHVEHCKLATVAGLPCLIEKPPAPDAAGARELAAVNPEPWVGFNRRFGRSGRLRADVPAAGAIELELEIRYRRASWNPVAVRDDALADLGSHLTDLAIHLGGDGDARVRRAATAPARAEVELELARGRALLRAGIDGRYRERFVVRRPGGPTLGMSATPGPLRGLYELVRGHEHPLVASLRAQLEAFARAVHGGDAGPLATARDGLRAMLLVDEARAVSAR